MTIATILVMAAAAMAPIADIPFDGDCGFILLESSIAGKPLTFLLDTGFDVSILDAGIAERLGLRVVETRVEAQPGGSVEMGRLAPVELTIGKLHVKDLNLQTAPIAAMGSFIGRDFHGIIGHDVLERYVVDIDYPKQRLRFHTADGWDHTGAGQVLPVTITNGEVFVTAGIAIPAGRTVFGPFKLDTGSIDVAGLNLNFVRDSALIASGTRELVVGGVAVGGNTEGRMFRADAIVIGAHRIETPLVGYTVDSGGFENRADAGTLGAAVLTRYRLILDYPRRRIILEDGPQTGGPVMEDHSGMLVVSPGPGYEALMVAQVIPDTPASEAGLQPGDILVSADGRDAWSLPEFRRALQQPGPLPLVVKRKDSLLEITLKRRPLLPRISGDRPGA